MIVKKCTCDHCGQIIEDNSRFLATFTGHNKADLCKGCYEEFISRFSNWLKNKPVNDYKKEIEDKTAIHYYQQQIIELKEELDKTRANRNLWFNTCKEIAKNCNALYKKVDEIMISPKSEEWSND